MILKLILYYIQMYNFHRGSSANLCVCCFSLISMWSNIKIKVSSSLKKINDGSLVSDSYLSTPYMTSMLPSSPTTQMRE